MPDKSKVSDVYAIGFQEIVDLSTKNVVLSNSASVERAQYWQEQCTRCLATTDNHFTVIESKHLVGMFLVVLVRETLLPMIGDVRSSSLGIGVLGMMGNKGGICIRLTLYDSTICFVCSHLRAGQNATEGRNSDHHTILEKLVLEPTKEGLTSRKVPGGPSRQWLSIDLSKDLSISDHEYVFWFGDLNYRIDISSSSLTIEDVIESAKGDWYTLIDKDQLNIERVSKSAVFHDYEEGTLTFPPTYKYQPGTDSYDVREKKLRVPAWCDRVLWRTLNGSESVQQTSYRRGVMNMSDHKPVCATFNCDMHLSIPDKERMIYQELLAIIDKWENSIAPKVNIEDRLIEMDNVTFNTPVRCHVIKIQNTGTVIASWQFVPKFEEVVVCKDWLSFKPHCGVIAPGECAQVNVVIDVNANTAPEVLAASKSSSSSSTECSSLEDIAIIRVIGGSDFFCHVSIKNVLPEHDHEHEHDHDHDQDCHSVSSSSKEGSQSGHGPTPLYSTSTRTSMEDEYARSSFHSLKRASDIGTTQSALHNTDKSSFKSGEDIVL